MITVDLYRRMLRLDVGPHQRSKVLHKLGDAHLNRFRMSNAPEDLKEAIGAYSEALQAATPDARRNIFRGLSRAHQALSQFQDASENLELARSTLQEALDGLLGEERAVAMMELGRLHLAFDELEPGANGCRKAIEAFEEALSLHVPEDGRRAEIQSSLSMAYRRLAEVEGSEDHCLSAIAASQEAWSYYREAGGPAEQAYSRMRLANAYFTLSECQGETYSLDAAILEYREALSGISPEEEPELNSSLQNNLGIALTALAERLPPEEGEGSCRLAIEAFEEALDLRIEGSAGWAAVQNNLGNAYYVLGGLIDEGGEELLSRAVEAFKASVAGMPKQMASAQANLGEAHLAIANKEGASREHLMLAVECLESALERIPPDTPERARASGCLALACSLLAQEEGEPKWSSRAQASAREALRFYVKERFPREYADMQSLLWAGCADSADANPEEEIEQHHLAISAGEEAILIYEPGSEEWAMMARNLAHSHIRCREADDPAHLRRGAMLLRSAAPFFEPNTAPYAELQKDLGFALACLAQLEDGEENSRMATKAYKKALRFYSGNDREEAEGCQRAIRECRRLLKRAKKLGGRTQGG
ncbi:MAG: hypothetical protein JW986_10915 [Methanotrichaceae archaeon]|nr:hypothetical protein [Methanotrichaceae archaeon]